MHFGLTNESSTFQERPRCNALKHPAQWLANAHLPLRRTDSLFYQKLKKLGRGKDTGNMGDLSDFISLSLFFLNRKSKDLPAGLAGDACASPHPSWKGQPGGNAVTQVSHHPDDNDGGIQVADFGLETRRNEQIESGDIDSLHNLFSAPENDPQKQSKESSRAKENASNQQANASLQSYKKKKKKREDTLFSFDHTSVWYQYWQIQPVWL